MKTLLLIILFCSLSFAQDIITSRGSGSYTYVFSTGTDQIVNGDLYLYLNFTRTQTDTGSYSPRWYIVWTYTSPVFNSKRSYVKIPNSFR